MNEVNYTIGKLFANTGCITQDVMLRYADGGLTDEQSRQVELHLVDCPLCDEALEGIMLCGAAQFERMVAEVGEKVTQITTESGEEKGKVIEFRPNINPPQANAVPAATTQPVSGFRRIFPFIGIAASIALVVTLGVFFMQDSATKIADRNFSAIGAGDSRAVIPESPTTPDAVAPGSDEEEAARFEEALSLYKAQKYQQAAVKFDQDRNPKAGLYAGDCYYLLGNYQLAALRYQKVIDAKQGLEDRAEYNLALTYLKMDEVAQARIILERISHNSEHDFSGKAKTTLEDVIGL
ncbi:MAG TPA: tetratricopeptide repeat protein [Bacteroidia bacterium]|nr:tetratricopeptide repeat protein [Bacteroidia bacterium]